MPTALQDAALAAVFGAIAIIEAGARDDLHAGPAAANIPITTAVVLLLALRRVAPVRVLLATCAIIALPTFFVRHDFLVWSHMAPIVIETYTVARLRGVRIALLSLIGVFVALGVIFTVLEPWDPQTLLWCSLFFAVIFVGDTLRRSAVARDGLVVARLRLEADRDERARSAVLAERARLALELQGTVSRAVALMTAQAEAADGVLDRDPLLAGLRVAALERAGREATADLRRMLGLLRIENDPAEVTPRPRLSSLASLADRVATPGRTLEVTVDGDADDLPLGFSTSVYRLVEDAVAAGFDADLALRVAVRCGGDVEIRVAASTGVIVPSPPVRDRVALLGGDLVGGRELRIRLPRPDRP